MAKTNLNDWHTICAYTRKEAIADGIQVQIPEAIRKEAGWKIPVFTTATVWDKYVCVPKELPNEGQSENGRLWDILWMARFHKMVPKKNYGTFQLSVVYPTNKGDWETNEKRNGENSRLVTLHIEVQGTDFDNPEPCIMISKPQDD